MITHIEKMVEQVQSRTGTVEYHN